MSAAVAALEPAPAPRFVVGRTFVSPVFDYLVIGGGLSLVYVAVFVWGGPAWTSLAIPLPGFLLATTLAHFASSTVRLYTREGAQQRHPFLTMGLPAASLAVLTVAIAFGDVLGHHLQNLYLTWSPYHYAAQAYGLAVMYCYRSGVALPDFDKKLLRAACLTPFLFAFFRGPSAGIEWFVPASVLALPALAAARSVLVIGLAGIALLAPLALYVRAALSDRMLPMISILVVASNSIWWVVLLYRQAFGIATVFHGLQYLAIVTIFHVQERLKQPDNTRGWLVHALGFYAMCIALAWGLFYLWPWGYVLLGFGVAESALLTVAAINVHHFIVDAFIWRLRGDSNYKIVASGGVSLALGWR